MIGVIGGMGPYAGIDLCTEILNATDASIDQDHIPFLLSSQPGLVADRAGFIFDPSKPNPSEGIIPQVEALAKAGATVIGIPCVTAHAAPIMDEVRSFAKELGIEALSIVQETLKFIEENYPGVSNVGTISTHASYQLGLFNTPLKESELEFIDIGIEVNKDLVVSAIRDTTWGIKAISDPVSPIARDKLVEALQLLRKKKAEAVILGCTEIPLAIPESEFEGMKMINPMKALARALVKQVAPRKLKGLGESENPK